MDEATLYELLRDLDAEYLLEVLGLTEEELIDEMRDYIEREYDAIVVRLLGGPE